MYQYYQIMICLLKFDFFFFTGVTMQASSFRIFNIGNHSDESLASYHSATEEFS